LVKAEKITSSRLRQQVREQRQVLVQQQELQQQVREQQQVQEELLFYRKRPKQPTKLPRGVIFSWGFLNDSFEKFRGDATCFGLNLYMQPSRWTQAPSTQPLIIGEFPYALSVGFFSLINGLADATIQLASIPPKLTKQFH